MCTPPTPVSQILPSLTLSTLSRSWLEEDTPSFDYAAAILPSRCATAHLYAKSRIYLAGRPFFDAIFRELNCKVDWKFREGVWIDGSANPKTVVAHVTGDVKDILKGERVALNAISECTRVATVGRSVVDMASRYNWHGRIAGTRKTLPGLRLLQKYGYIIARVDPHRMDLSSMIMLKDNHLSSCRDVRQAVEDVKRIAGFSVKIDVECSTIDEALEAANAGADVVMLDNFAAESVKQCADVLRKRFPKLVVEVSGVKELLRDAALYFVSSVDVVSLSVQKMHCDVDYSLKLVDD